MSHPLDDLAVILPSIAEDANFDARAASAAAMALARQRMDISNDKEFYTVIMFQTKEQLTQFLDKAGWNLEHDGYWIDGFKLADKMGIDIRPIDPATMHRVYGRVKSTKQQNDAVARGLEFFAVESLRKEKRNADRSKV